VADRVSLRPVGEDDLALLDVLTNDPVGAGRHGWFGWYDGGRVRRWWSKDGLLGDDGSTLMVTAGPDRIGFVAWRKIDTGRTSFCWSIGIALAPDAQGKGYGTDAQRLLVRYLFAHTQVNRIQAETEVDNVAERRALEKAGFALEGIQRGVAFRAGRWRDRVTYSVLRAEVDPAELDDVPGLP
jgi:RimJ/RimL family protein N-acetyltransferase